MGGGIDLSGLIERSAAARARAAEMVGRSKTNAELFELTLKELPAALAHLRLTADVVHQTVSALAHGETSGSVRTRHDDEVARLEARLASQPVIEQAKGILISRGAKSDDAAFDILRRASQRTNVPVRVIAQRIVATALEGVEHRPHRSS